MSSELPFPVRHYEPADCEVVAGARLPHWSQAGAICFITWRTADSLPRSAVDRLEAERAAHLRGGGRVDAVYRKLSRAGVERELDAGLGSCPLRDPACAKIVADALRHFDGERYILFDFVVMPNHVHVLAAFPDAPAMRKQCVSWKRFTAVALNQRLNRAGHFWQPDSFDHLTRSDAQFAKLRDYIADNPVRAGLAAGESLHYSSPVPEPSP